MDALSRARVSHNLRAHGDSQEVLSAVFFLIGVMMLLDHWLTGRPLLPYEVYGDMVVGIPAAVWADSLMAGSSFLFYGIHLNGHRPIRSSLARLIGSLMHASTIMLFAYGAWSHGAGDFLVCAALPFSGTFFWFAGLNAVDLIGALNNRVTSR